MSGNTGVVRIRSPRSVLAARISVRVNRCVAGGSVGMARHGIGSPAISGLPHRKNRLSDCAFQPHRASAYWPKTAVAPGKLRGWGMERRLHSRHRARATVYVVVAGRRGSLCKAHNLSANGVFVETRNLGLAKGSIVELAFAINLGAITKIHRRKAIVAHVSRGGTGLKMECYAAR